MNVHNLKETNGLVSLLKKYELILPLYFDLHFTVTNAMKEFVISNHFEQNKISILYDKPFIKTDFPQYSLSFINSIIEDNERIICGVSSTNWTPDEDFGVLFDALLNYEKSEYDLPKLVVFITGRGPLREFYENRIKEENMKRVCVIPVWLTHDDYPKLLSICDFGISLHQSSSQLDLPMKVLNIFGCSLPVLARGYHYLKDELVIEGTYGYCFDNSNELISFIKKYQLLFLKLIEERSIFQNNFLISCKHQHFLLLILILNNL